MQHQVELSDTVELILKEKGGAIWSVQPDDSVFRAVEMMSEKRVGALLVLNGAELAGIISERDYARKVILMGRSSKDTLVREVMTGQVLTVSPDMTVDECMHIMTDRRVRHLPVLDRHKIVGMISIGDLVRWIISSHEHTIHQLRSYIAGNYPG